MATGTRTVASTRVWRRGFIDGALLGRSARVRGWMHRRGSARLGWEVTADRDPSYPGDAGRLLPVRRTPADTAEERRTTDAAIDLNA
jgi:hypothetical protein